ncbi:MAG: asparagine--tRNA ligase [Chitinophagales bacterium]|nr:asparagine--tRNA ligase [Chitinophagales bacterium]
METITTNKLTYIKDLEAFVGQKVTLKGWLANKRSGKGIAFLILRDGSGFCQCVVTESDVDEESFENAKSLTLESAFEIEGNVVRDEKQMGGFELQATKLRTISIAEEYPIAKKEHGVDFLMDRRHLWLRSRKQWALSKIRNTVIFSIHQFFQERDFVQMDAPIFTGNACEGTTTLFETDFFGDTAYLSQSGQLYGEAMAMAQGLIYTFGPTFRAEKSKTRRHLAEFWMIEPEMAFYDLDMDMDMIEEFIKYVIKSVLDKNKDELEILERDTTSLQKVANTFPRLTYEKAVRIIKGEEDINGKNSITTLEEDLKEVLEKIETTNKDISERETRIEAGGMKKGEVNFNLNKIGKLKAEVKEFESLAENIPQWIESAKNFEFGGDFGGSDETVLTRLFDTPVMVYKWPAAIKAFYMKEDEEDPNFVKGVDLLAPEGFGEIVGGGERETSKELLVKKIKEHDLPMEAFEWYLDLRRFGSVPHAGFGLGLERLVGWICNIHHIRETIPFPRVMGRLLP